MKINIKYYQLGCFRKNEKEKGGTAMKRIVKILCITLLVFSLNSMVLANEQEAKSSSGPSPAAIVADVLVLRPAGLIGTILGSVAFVISLPVTLPMKKTEEAGKTLVMAPLLFTFDRPLGKM
jgi:hypothetical protein